MRRALTLLGAGLALALAVTACGGSAPTSTVPPATVTAGSPSAAASPLPADTEAAICGILITDVNSGAIPPQAAQDAENTYTSASDAQVWRAIQDHCPQLSGQFSYLSAMGNLGTWPGG